MHLSLSTSLPNLAMETHYTPEDQVRRFVLPASRSPAILLNEEEFNDLYNKRVKDHGLPSYNQSTCSAYQAYSANAQVRSTGM